MSSFEDRPDTRRADGESPWSAWPRCPRCNQPRQSACPVCQVSGTDFPLAEYQALGEPLRATAGGGADPAADTDQAPGLPLLRCPTCDEAFRPRFYRRCQRCGHDFQQGLDVRDDTFGELTPRVVLVIAGLLLVVGGLLCFFYVVLH